MPNFQISDLPLATLPLDSANSFFEVQTVEGGVPVSRRIAETNIMADLPDGTTVGSIIRLSVVPDLYVNSEQILADGTSVELQHVTTPVARTLTTAAGGLQVDNQFSGGGFERVLTQSDLLIALDDLTDVTLTAPATGAVLFKSAGNWLDTPGILIDPAADVKLHQAAAEVARTLGAAAGGFEANNTLTGAGFERVLTVADLFTGGLDDLSDVTLTAPATGSVLYKSAGDWLNTNAIQIDPAARVQLLDNSNLRFRTDINDGVAVFATTDIRPKIIFRDSADTTDQGTVGFHNTTSMSMRNSVSGGQIHLQMNDGSTRNAFQATPGADARLYFDNASVARTAAAASGGLEANNTATGAGFERVLTTADIFGGALNDLSDVTLTAPDTGAVLYKSAGNWLDTPGILIDPAADVKLHQNTAEVARTITAAAGGFQANNTLTGAGFERVLTASDIFGGALNDLSDVTIAAVLTSQTLRFNGANWVNASQILQTGDGLTMGGITTGITGVNVRGRFTNAGESGGSTQTTVSWLDDDGSVSFGEIEWRTTGGGTDGDTMYFRNRRHGGTIEFEGENDAGTLVPMSGFDPQTVINTLHTDIVVDGAAIRLIELFPTGGQRFQIQSEENVTTDFTMGFVGQASVFRSSEVGAVIVGNTIGSTGAVTIGGGNTDRIQFLTATTRSLGFTLTNTVDWDIIAEENGGELALRATQGGGTIVDMVLCDPDGAVSLSNQAVVTMRTQQGDVAGATSGGQIVDHTLTFRDIGFNVLPTREVPADLTLSEIDVGRILHRDGGLSGTITLPSGTSGAIPLVGAWIKFAVETATAVTITAAGTLRFFDGSGTPATGNRTISEGGIADLYHYSDTEWWIWGFGIT